MPQVWCPFHLGYVRIVTKGSGPASFAAHVQKCPDAPEAVKAAYRRPYP